MRALAIAALLAGCSSSPPVALDVQAPEVATDAELAAEAWNDVCGAGAITLAAGAPLKIRMSPLLAEYGYLAATNGFGIHVSPALLARDESGRVETLTHEMGHALGLEDSDDPEDIMYRYATGTRHVRRVNCDQVAGRVST